ncbi:hypothetical protein [Pseudoalteromonas luteoviolacea]|uniref:Letm1 RBD domain-containing protein n=1 Tax=Pseudoalteromonas luteoviolacea DSM 6061 TaxID=1365250 RepID=A0A166WYK2_9GAMM|nr:hypothetical protein [Pseudoalteromonas luteoviolacea]KZN39041.1 hypothetical protein N475_14620 [Pseudoalteromonas luteoviolacea DSM 6061]KZN56903.1 hypothetical protein N474_09795 [Pseudoalteromonas luteoviolacea CPMOR-2]MBE0389933.1 hypothetical protein [Pseudoalteromonas luteoviolacea DSM 6061]TQF67517.1 hypothetical protein FLM44_20250 [Pseudoalteromonas luteoviolacea]
MRLIKVAHKAPIRVVRIGRKRQKLKLKRSLIALKGALAQEKQETEEMLAIYKRYTQGHASKEELKVANKQFVDVLKGLGLGIFAILPFAPITIPIIIALGNKLGVDVLPSSFSNHKEAKRK